MANSALHEHLVRRLVEFVNQESHGNLALYVDGTFFSDYPRPPNIGGSIPDLYGRKIDRTLEIIGEAKTPKDWESQHTRDQIESYIQYLAKSGAGVLVIATHWEYVPHAKTLVRFMLRRSKIENVRTVFLYGGKVK